MDPEVQRNSENLSFPPSYSFVSLFVSFILIRLSSRYSRDDCLQL